MAARAPSLPPLPPLFPPAFRARLHALIGQRTGMRGAPDAQRRARRSMLSQSGTFVGHRPYEHGDDLRRIDWPAYARTGQLYVKQLEQEQRRTAALLLDLSASLLAGEPPRRVPLLRGAAVVGGFALAQLDGLTVLAPGAGALAERTFAGVAAVPELLAHLEALPVAAAGAGDAVGMLLRRGLPGRVHWFSDFALPAACERPLHALRRRGAVVTGWLPELPADRAPEPSGYLRVTDPETGEELTLPVDEAFVAELRRQLALLAVRQDRLFAQAGARLVRWRAPALDDMSAPAFAVLAARCEP